MSLAGVHAGALFVILHGQSRVGLFLLRA
jgi:hypothetical protein